MTRRRRTTLVLLVIAGFAVTACSSSPEADGDAPVASVTEAGATEEDGDLFTSGDSATDDDSSSPESGSDADGTDEDNDEAVTEPIDDASGESANSETDSDASTDADEPTSESEGAGTDSGGSASDDPITELTPDEIEEAGPIDDETRDVLEEAEEEFRNRPDAEPGELALDNADFVYETRFIGGEFIGTTGTVDVPVGSMIAFNLVTDVDDDVIVTGSETVTDVREATNADSALVLFIADTVGDFVIEFDAAGTELLRVNAS